MYYIMFQYLLSHLHQYAVSEESEKRAQYAQYCLRQMEKRPNRTQPPSMLETEVRRKCSIQILSFVSSVHSTYLSLCVSLLSVCLSLSGGVCGTVVARWTASQQVELSILRQGHDS